MDDAMLALNKVNAFYGKAHVLQDISLSIKPLERAAILGRNGMGKSTLLRTVLGLSGINRQGDIHFQGKNLTVKNTHEIANLGIAYVPQGWQLFPSLSVEEHLMMAYKPKRGGQKHEWTPDLIYELFPEIKDRRKISGTRLSGGEQQMLAISRALVTNPAFILMDEPSEGISTFVLERIIDICHGFTEQNITLLLVEQNLDLALKIAQKVYILVNGRIIHQADVDEFRDDKESQELYLGV